MKSIILIISIFCNFNIYSYTGVEEYVPGEIIALDDINDRLFYIESLHQIKNINITLPRFEAGPIKASDFNEVINLINNLEILGSSTIELVSSGSLISASKVNQIIEGLNYAKHICLNREDCYSRINELELGNISHLVITDSNLGNDLLFNDNTSNLLISGITNKYLGVECDSWYQESEKSWASIKMTSSLSNYIAGVVMV